MARLEYLGPRRKASARDVRELEGMAGMLERGYGTSAVGRRFGISHTAVYLQMRRRQRMLARESRILAPLREVLEALAGLHNANG